MALAEPHPATYPRLALTRHAEAVAVSVISFALFLWHLLTASEYLVNWDAVQFALGIRDFDLAHHQPHPPGYVGYIFLGRLLLPITGDPATSLTVISAASGALAVVVFWAVARGFLRPPVALGATALFASSPLLLYYSKVALTYAPEVPLALGAVAFAQRAIARPERRWLVLAAVMLALLGAVRPTGMVLMLPLALWVGWQCPRQARLRAAGALLLVTGLWLVPLAVLSGGPIVLVRETLSLFGATGGSTSAATGGVSGIEQNLAFTGVGFALALGTLALTLPLVVIVPRRVARREGAITRPFLLFWVVPALAVFLLGHTGQLGYVLLIAPAAFVAAGLFVERWWDGRVRSAACSREPGAVPIPVAAWVLGCATLALAVGNAAIYHLAPAFIYSSVGSGSSPAFVVTSNDSGTGTAAEDGLLPDPVGAPLLAEHARQYDIAASDRFWESFVEFTSNFDPETTAILTTPGSPRVAGSFRHAGYYLPDYPVYGLGPDSHDVFGVLFTTHHGDSSYGLDRFADGTTVLPLDPGIRTLIIADAGIVPRLDPGIGYGVADLGPRRVVVVPVHRGSMLYFRPAEGDGENRIALLRPLVQRRINSDDRGPGGP